MDRFRNVAGSNGGPVRVPEAEVASGGQKKAPRNVRPISDSRRREGWSAARGKPRSGLRCPIYNRVDKGLSLTDRI